MPSMWRIEGSRNLRHNGGGGWRNETTGGRGWSLSIALIWSLYSYGSLSYGVFPKIVVPPFHHPKMMIFSRKTLVVGYHHFRKHPKDHYINIIMTRTARNVTLTIIKINKSKNSPISDISQTNFSGVFCNKILLYNWTEIVWKVPPNHRDSSPNRRDDCPKSQGWLSQYNTFPYKQGSIISGLGYGVRPCFWRGWQPWSKKRGLQQRSKMGPINHWNESWDPLSTWVFPKIVVPQIIHFNRVFHHKPSILGYPYFWKHPHTFPWNPLMTRLCWLDFGPSFRGLNSKK